MNERNKKQCHYRGIYFEGKYLNSLFCYYWPILDTAIDLDGEKLEPYFASYHFYQGNSVAQDIKKTF